MPLLQTSLLNAHTIIGIWQTEETTETLKKLLPAHMEAASMAHVHPRREREWLASRVLAYSLLQYFTNSTNSPPILERNEHGRPYFSNAPFHISISHSPQLAAVILSDKYEVGIDIELVSQKALRVADKFLSEAEKTYTASNENRTCLYWSAKETLYKLYSRKKLIFKDNLIIIPPSENQMMQGQIKIGFFDKLYEIHHEEIQNHVLTYCYDNKTT
ncbi:4'-phosphopantetheinyl transferase superfamily protein [Pontibacter sp. MBLB2868]|uniref:4'-phosphopantetheinyl transferase superfamily protein n=1 Tax=Pontibacter sp. MBLB2868 TaxID=3451555 RepID=UPI003F74C9B2